MHSSSNVDNMKKEIEDHGLMVIIWNIKKQATSKIIPMFYIELKPENSNKNMYEVKSLL
jgi:hypothetical protein